MKWQILKNHREKKTSKVFQESEYIEKYPDQERLWGQTDFVFNANAATWKPCDFGQFI